MEINPDKVPPQPGIELSDIIRSGMFLCGLAGSVIVWSIDPFIDAVLLHQGTFYGLLTDPSAKQLHFTAIVSILLLAFGFVASLLLTRSRRTEQALQKSEEKLSKIFHTTPDPVILSRVRDGLLLYVNPAFADMAGPAPEEVIGKTVFDLGLWANPQDREKVIRELAKKGEVRGFETEFTNRDGRTLLVSISVSGIEMDGERCMVSVIRDINERNRIEKEVERAYYVQEALREILYISLQPLTLQRMLARALDAVLTSPVFHFEKKGAIFLAREGEDILELKVHRGLPEPLQTSCSMLPFGECLCGRAAAKREIVFSGQMDARHDIGYDGIQPHGHYCTPILSGDRLLGVLNCYVQAGYTRKAEDERFLVTVADTLALAIGHMRAEQSLQASHENLTAIMNSMDSLVYIADMDSHELLFVNKYGRKTFGDVTGKICWQSIQTDQSGPCEFCTNGRLLSADGNPTGVYVWQVQNTVTKRWYECHDQAVTWFDGRTVRMEIATDITERRQDEEKIKHMASHDMLTGLPNRALFMDRLEQALARCRRNESMAAVMFIDLDNFKPVNDTVGHTLGDRVLKQISDRLSSCVRETDTVARFGGDEFVVLMADIENTEAPSRIAEKMNAVLAEPINLGSKEVVLGASIGIALYPHHAYTSEVLISLADKAMYEVKKNTKKGYLYAIQSEAVSA